MYSNKHMSVAYHPKTEHSKAYILVKDLKDDYNETTAYTRKVRGISRAWTFIIQIMNNYELQDDLTFYDIIKILDDKFALNTRQYCAMD